MKQIDRRQAGEKADEPGEADQPQIVLGGQAGEYTKHAPPQEFGGVTLARARLTPC